MDETQRRNRRLGWLLLAVGLVVVVIFVIASLLQPPVPPGTAIVNVALPAKHPAGPCYHCHQGIPAAAKLAGKQPPTKHPTAGCETCHEGYAPPPAAPKPRPG